MMKLLRLCLMLLGIAAVASAGGLRGGALQLENEIVSEHEEERELHSVGHWQTSNRYHGQSGTYHQPTTTYYNTNSWYNRPNWSWSNYWSNYYNGNSYYYNRNGYYNRPTYYNNYSTGHRQGGYYYYSYSF